MEVLNELLHWTDLLFLMPTIVGIVCFFLSISVDSDTDVGGAISVPLLLLLAPALCGFGIVGLVTNYVLHVRAPGNEWTVCASLVVSLLVTLVFCRVLGRFLKHHVPLIESSATSLADKVGAQGQTVIDTTPDSGLVSFTDQGDVYQLRAVSSSGTIPKNTDVVVVDYDAATHTCTVFRLP